MVRGGTSESVDSLSPQIQINFSLISDMQVILLSKADKGIEAPAIGAKGGIAMHNTEHKPAQDEAASTPEQKGATTTGRQKMPRAW